MPLILRALEGLPPGTVVVVERRVTLGRAPDVDLQLLDPSVSRRHAKIEVDAQGVVRLVDLASKSGTFVDGARVERCRIEDGQTIEIGRFHLRFEEVADVAIERKPQRHAGMDAMRQTALFGPGNERPPTIVPVRDEGTARLIVSEVAPSAMAAPTSMRPGTAPRGPIEPVDGFESNAVSQIDPTPLPPRRPSPQTQQTRARNSRRWTPTGVPANEQVNPEARTSTSHHAVLDEVEVEVGVPVMLRERDVPEPLASMSPITDEMPPSDGPRDVVRSVFEYRGLRLRGLRGEPLDEESNARLQRLENRLQQQLGGGGAASVRRFKRFDCPLPAWIGAREGRHVSTWAVELEDISAGGAQVRVAGQGTTFAPGDACWLVVDLDDDAEQPVVVFRARVVWSLPEDGRMGLVFSGAASAGIDAVELIRADLGM